MRPFKINKLLRKNNEHLPLVVLTEGLMAINQVTTIKWKILRFTTMMPRSTETGPSNIFS